MLKVLDTSSYLLHREAGRSGLLEEGIWSFWLSISEELKQDIGENHAESAPKTWRVLLSKEDEKGHWQLVAGWERSTMEWEPEKAKVGNESLDMDIYGILMT